MTNKKKSIKRENDIKKKDIEYTPKGLHNLGNTCYLNSALQCLGRVNLLTDLVFNFVKQGFPATISRLTDKANIETLELYMPLFESPLSDAYVSLMIDLFGTENTRTSISPSMLRAPFIDKFPSFEGFGQHDSHEVLRCLLDGLRQEEIKRWQRAILNKLKIDSQLNQLSEGKKTEVKSWGRATNLSTIVDRIFAGIMLTTLTCKECETVCQHFEVFLDISLPIVDIEFSSLHQNNGHDLSNPIENEPRPPKTKRERKAERKAKPVRRKGKKNRRNKKHWTDSEEEEENNGKGKEEENNSEKQKEGEDSEKGKEEENNEKPKEGENSQKQKEENKFVEKKDKCGGNVTPKMNTGEGMPISSAADSPEMLTFNSTGDEGEIYQSAGNAGDLEDNSEGGISDSSESPDVQIDKLTSGMTNLRVSPAGEAVRVDETNAQEISLKPLGAPRSKRTDLERCLERYTAAELLFGPNRSICGVCTKRKFGISSSESVRCDTVKRDLIIRPPAILTIHLKRFQQIGSRLQKCSKKISFPIDLDLGPFCSRLSRPLPLGCKVTYRLFGVVEHSGHLRGGHYVSYVAASDLSERQHLPDPQFISSLEKPEPWPMTLHHLVYQMRRANQEVINGNHDLDDVSDATMEASQPMDTRKWFYCSDGHVSPVTLTTLLNTQPYLLFYERVA